MFGGGGALGALGAIVDGLGDILGYVAHGLEHLAQEVKTYWKVVVAVALAVVTAGLAAPLIVAYLATTFAITSATAMAALTAVVTGAVAGAVMGAGMTALNGGSIGDILSAGFKGAAVGAFAGAATWGAGAISAGWGFVGQAVAHGVAGGLTGIAAGGSFQKGFEYAVLAYGAFALYEKLVGYKASWKPGKGAVNKDSEWPKKGRNNFGSITKPSPGYPVGSPVVNPCGHCEGSTFSWAMNNFLPGGPAISGTHDALLAEWQTYIGVSIPQWYNIVTMLPAAAFSYAALINTPISYGMISSYIDGDYGHGG